MGIIDWISHHLPIAKRVSSERGPANEPGTPLTPAAQPTDPQPAMKAPTIAWWKASWNGILLGYFILLLGGTAGAFAGTFEGAVNHPDEVNGNLPHNQVLNGFLLAVAVLWIPAIIAGFLWLRKKSNK